MSIRFPTEAANADVLDESPAASAAGGPPSAPGTPSKQDHRVSRGERAAGDLRGERPRPRKDIGGTAFTRDGGKGTP